MDPVILEKRRLIRLKNKPILPKGLYLWKPNKDSIDNYSEEDYSNSTDVSPKMNIKTKKSNNNKKRKNLKDNKKEKNILKNNSKKSKNNIKIKEITKLNKSSVKNIQSPTKKFIGPVPLPTTEKKIKGYGEGLYQGEGEAIATFVQKGIRIPRRGEIGLTSKQIEEYENLGYVMSGSRHKKMNAIRIRKENQVYCAEEKQALSVIQFEEKVQKEKKLIADMRNFLKSQINTPVMQNR